MIQNNIRQNGITDPSKPSIYLINESTSKVTNPSIIASTAEDITFRACMQEGDMLNRNNKIYPANILEAASKEPLIQTQLATKTWYGEANHPNTDDLKRQMWLDHKNISHSLRTYVRKGNNFYSDVLTFRNEMGKSMKGAVEQGSTLSFSLRGLHKLGKKPNSTALIVEALRMFCYDWVTFPAHPGANMVSAAESVNFSIFIGKQELQTVLASEGVSPLGALEDFVQADITSGKFNVGLRSLSMKVNDNTIVIPLRSITSSIITDILG